ncbi:PREDICTED: uncharacterized protein LOC109176331 [Ipomoea nil]|uniref:uncharacterized protein LOC109176331 n=1 Tax=Ipomoea nil TaxID=35883 RepID=UPI0009011B88|nr:PREDICTED: uncharacterized protein LOC109176331 [Ipomoea nil]XP_019181314.1 PREDICTED: uncharacterized protein LOC109176331 [Ipomoea nil]
MADRVERYRIAKRQKIARGGGAGTSRVITTGARTRATTVAAPSRVPTLPAPPQGALTAPPRPNLAPVRGSPVQPREFLRGLVASHGPASSDLAGFYARLLEMVLHCTSLLGTHEALQGQVADLTRSLEREEDGRLRDNEDLRREIEVLREELGRAVPDYRRSPQFAEDAMAYARAHRQELIDEWQASEEGRSRLKEEGMAAYDVGLYTIQQDLYAILEQQDPAFDPEERGLLHRLPRPGGPADAAAPVGVVDLRTLDELFSGGDQEMSAGQVSPTPLQSMGSFGEDFAAFQASSSVPDLNG